MTAESPAPLSRAAVVTAVLALTLAFAWQAVTSMRRKSVTTDEAMYIAAGYYHVRTGSFRLNMTNPPLMKVVTAVPLLALDPELRSIAGDPERLSLPEQWQFAREFLYSNRVDADAMVFAARLPVVVLGVLLGLLLFDWSRRLYGQRAGLLALGLYAFSPNMLAHTRLATQDLGLAAFFVATCYAFWSFVRGPGIWALSRCGLALGAAVLTKTTSIFLFPILAAWLGLLVLLRPGEGTWERAPIVRRMRPERVRARQLVSFGVALAGLVVVVVLLINIGYGFDGTFEPFSPDGVGERVYRRLPFDHPALRAVVDAGAQLPCPLPHAFVELVKFQFGKVAAGSRLYFAGEASTTGWWYLMPAAFGLKTPLPFLALIAAAGWSLVRARRASSAELLLLVACGVLATLFSVLKGISIGLRYMLPVYPLLHVLASRVLREGVGPLRARARVALALLGAWYVGGTLWIHPHYLAYFNELIGGPRNGYRWLADSNLDWGQDLRGLARYLEERGIERIRLAYFGSADASYYGIRYDYLPSVGLAPTEPGERWWYERKPDEPLPPLELSGGPIAVSATLLAGVFYPGYYAPLRSLEPIAQIGYSILVYDP